MNIQENKIFNEDEEECYVILELNDYEKGTIFSSTKEISLLGLDTQTPFLQLDDKVFKGHYEDTFGTYILFEEKEDKQKHETVYAPSPCESSKVNGN